MFVSTPEFLALLEAARDAAIALSWADRGDPRFYIDALDALDRALEPFEEVNTESATSGPSDLAD